MHDHIALSERNVRLRLFQRLRNGGIVPRRTRRRRRAVPAVVAVEARPRALIALCLRPARHHADAFYAFLGQLVDKARRKAAVGASVKHTLPCVADAERLLGARDGDVAEPPLLLHLIRIAEASRTGEKSLLHADKEHIRKFQSLGAVHGHHDDGVRVGVILLDVGIERDLLQKTGECRRIAVFHIAEDAGFEFADVFRAGARFHVVLFLQHGEIARPHQHLVVKTRKAQRLQQLRAFLDHDCERHQLLRRLFKARIAVGVGNDTVERQGSRG